MAEVDNPIGISLVAMDVQPVGCMLFFTQSGGNVTGRLQTGQWYEIQTQNLSGEWADCSDRDVEKSWEDIAYIIEEDTTRELDLNWENDYGYLSDGHYRIAKKVMDYRAPGDYAEYEVYAEFDITEENGAAERVDDWMRIDLPTGYYTSNFYDNLGWMGGALILPRVHWEEKSEYIPVEWRYSGLISRIPAANTDITFADGLPDLSGVPIQNHTDEEYIGVIGLERSANQWPAILLKEAHDLYTHPEIEEVKQQGKYTDDMKLTADYWYFWFVKEGEDIYYVLSLSADEFSQEEAERIAGTVVIK